MLEWENSRHFNLVNLFSPHFFVLFGLKYNVRAHTEEKFD